MAMTGQALISTQSSSGASGIHPNTGAFISINSFQLVTRIHNCTASGGIFWDNDIALTTTCTGATFVDWRDMNNGYGGVSVSFPPGAGDVVIRAMRNSSNQMISIEVWRTDTGAYLEATETIPNADWHGTITDMPGEFGIAQGQQTGCACAIDYVRFFSSVPSSLAVVPSSNAGGDLGDWEFEGNLLDSSAYKQTLVMSGASFTSTPSYAPIVSFTPASNCFLNQAYSQQFCTITTSSTSISASAYSPNQNDALTYQWSAVTGPISFQISSTNSPSAVVEGLTAVGEYDVRLTVTDLEGHSGQAVLGIGAVKVGSNNCLISNVPAAMQKLIGPLTPWGSTQCDPWPWYDMAEAANALTLQSKFALPASFRAAPAAGTVSVQNDTVTVIGSGTHFASACGGGSCAGWAIFLLWNAPLTSSPVLSSSYATGRSLQVVNQVIDDTHMTLQSSDYKYLPPLAQSQNIRFQPIGNWNDPNFQSTIVGFGWQAQPSYSWNYYDNVIAYYRLYFRTGIHAFLAQARQLADVWYVWNIDQGYSSNSTPRVMALAGLIARAQDGHPEYWPGIEAKLSPFSTYNPPSGDFDSREVGYDLSYLSLASELDPNTGNRGGYCTSVSNAITYFLGPQQLSNGSFWANNYLINQSTPSYGQGASPWLEGVIANGLKDAYRTLNDPNGCNNTAVGQHAFTMLGNLLTFIYKYGAAGTRSIPAANGGGTAPAGIWYAVGVEASGEPPTDWVTGPGSVSGSAGSKTLTGSTSFFTDGVNAANTSGWNYSNSTAGFAPCNGSTFIGILNTLEVHRVVGCPSNNSLALGEALGASVSGSTYQIVQRDGSTSCAPSLATWCFGGISSDYEVLLPGIYGWYYQISGNAQYKTWGDQWFSLAYGGAAGGPGSVGAPVGPDSSGTTVSGYGYISMLPSCATTAAPCNSSVLGTSHYGKDFGDGSGYVGAGSNYLAYRLMAGSPQP